MFNFNWNIFNLISEEIKSSNLVKKNDEKIKVGTQIEKKQQDFSKRSSFSTLLKNLEKDCKFYLRAKGKYENFSQNSNSFDDENKECKFYFGINTKTDKADFLLEIELMRNEKDTPKIFDNFVKNLKYYITLKPMESLNIIIAEKSKFLENPEAFKLFSLSQESSNEICRKLKAERTTKYGFIGCEFFSVINIAGFVSDSGAVIKLSKSLKNIFFTAFGGANLWQSKDKIFVGKFQLFLWKVVQLAGTFHKEKDELDYSISLAISSLDLAIIFFNKLFLIDLNHIVKPFFVFQKINKEFLFGVSLFFGPFIVKIFFSSDKKWMISFHVDYKYNLTKKDLMLEKNI
jgi:hypothetical protein